jgi:hypothetical protein
MQRLRVLADSITGAKKRVLRRQDREQEAERNDRV